MQAHNDTIEEFLGAPKTVFVVPVYQRNYDWKPENCEQLFQDIIGIVTTKKEHFLGTICFKVTNSHERAIIDGQQRLTSITLLLKAIYDFDSDDDVRKEIHDQYLYNSGRGIDTDFLRFKLHLNKRDDIIFHILLDSTSDNVEERLTSTQKRSNLYRNYLFFSQMIRSYADHGGSTGDILEALRSLTIIELEIQQENPQEIFESMNSTGKDLTNVDLLRNFFLMQFGYREQTQLYDDYWSFIEDAIGTERMEQFFVDFLVFKKRSDALMLNGRRSHINEPNLYYAFKDYYSSIQNGTAFEKTQACFAELKYCAEIYKQFVFAEDSNLDRESPMRRKLYFLLSINESSKARSLLLYIFDLNKRGLIDELMLEEAVDAISSLTFRARICKAQGINRQFAGSVMLRLDEIHDYSVFTDRFWRAITVGKGSYAFPSDDEFEEALINRDLYQVLRSRGTKYLLYMLEMHSQFSRGLPSIDDETITVEHIMPQKLSDHWKNYLSRETMEQYEEALHRLGNLTLTNYNGEMSNKSFADKKRIFAESSFFYTRQLQHYSEWQISQINERARELAKKALLIWKLPAQYQSRRALPASLHALGEDTSQFAFTKPSLLLIANSEFSVNYWSELLPILCKVLDEENHDAFVETANPEKMAFFGVEDNEHKYSTNNSFTRVTDSIYVRTNQSAAGILESMRRVSIAFDEIAGTDYMTNVLFALR